MTSFITRALILFGHFVPPPPRLAPYAQKLKKSPGELGLMEDTNRGTSKAMVSYNKVYRKLSVTDLRTPCSQQNMPSRDLELQDESNGA